jgi:hypothetical protein
MKMRATYLNMLDGWQIINPDSLLIGRAVTATFARRPDVHDAIDDRGK